MHTGSCLCGNITFQISAPLSPIEVCHCTQCRKAQGSAFAAITPVAVSAFRLTDSQGLMKTYESSPGKERAFCGRCGSPVFSRRAALPGVLRVRAGLIDEPAQVGVAWHAYTASGSSWWTVTDGLPQHAGAYVPPGACEL
ncbi:GFA family protein [Caenimonas sedimenti]|uniref:GFA family protein n=1 Tax=Caenimonas sedimenti TaxID=2596921 RepID=A0A562ZRC0_9BURK|nr:GFA family protein [Caenimonas sedimenti]TWO70858.1 GFA family protein [Caenimonas sedimenti]